MGIFKRLEKYIPESIEIIENKETGETAFQINNKPNPIVPERVQSYKNNKISLYSWGGRDIFKTLGKQERKKLKWEDQVQEG